jgi:hypothetical protein
LILSLTGTAFANLSGSTFEGNDGNMVVNTSGNTDWANVAGLNTGIDQPSGSSDNAFGQGTKEDVPAVTVVDGSIPPTKNDLTRFYEAFEQAANGHIYLYLGWERAVNIGNANLDFEINQKTTASFTAPPGAITLNRTAGDLLVTYDFGGSGTPTLGLNTWLVSAASPVVPGFSTNVCLSSNTFPCWGDHISLGGNAEGAVNSSTIAEPIAGGSLSTGLFGEAAIDLTAAGVFRPGVCEAFGSTFVKSRSSSSFTAEIKDFIAPIPVSISNCGTIVVKKVTENGDSSFGYTTSGLSPSSFSLSNGDTQTFSNLSSGTYGVTENLASAQVSAGWTLKSLVCSPANTVTVNGSAVTINLPLGGTVTCTYTNHINLSPTIATTLSAATINIGDSVHDSAVLSGATANAGGKVTFVLYSPSDATCAGTPAYTQSVNVSGSDTYNTTNTTFLASTEGTWRWMVGYSGDGNNVGSTSACGVEQFTIANH